MASITNTILNILILVALFLRSIHEKSFMNDKWRRRRNALVASTQHFGACVLTCLSCLSSWENYAVSIISGRVRRGLPSRQEEDEELAVPRCDDIKPRRDLDSHWNSIWDAAFFHEWSRRHVNESLVTVSVRSAKASIWVNVSLRFSHRTTEPSVNCWLRHEWSEKSFFPARARV